MWKGHPIELRDGSYIYLDTLSPVRDNPRSCGVCGEWPTDKEHDACIPNLPGVMNACCGHGNEEEAYVQFTSIFRLGGAEACAWIAEYQIRKVDDERIK